MLVLKGVYDRNGKTNLRYAFINRKDLFLYCKQVKLLIFNTETLETESILLGSIVNILDTIFGIVFDESKNIICISVDDTLWNILDYIEKPIKMPDKFSIYNFYEDIIELMNKSSSPLNHVYKSGAKEIVVSNKISTMTPLDDDCIFWRISDSNFCTISHIYNTIFSTVVIDETTDVYMKSFDGKIYKLDTNKNCIRFMTKLKVLNG